MAQGTQVTFERTTDYVFIRAVLTHPKVYPGITDDSAPPSAEYEPIEHEGIWYVRVVDRGRDFGVFVFVPHGAICWEVHTALLPIAWGPAGKQAAREIASWIWANTPCRRIFTNVPEFNRLALRFAEAAGMTRFGVNASSYLKDGRVYDQILLGLTRP
jgi:RimJ/RimL family protein N-acetyltransferase